MSFVLIYPILITMMKRKHVALLSVVWGLFFYGRKLMSLVYVCEEEECVRVTASQAHLYSGTMKRYQELKQPLEGLH